MSSSGFKYLYGPVPSRRLGRSLGIDLVPFKTCTYDCIYCQLGHTTNKTLERLSYVPVKEILNELKRKLATGERPDYISIAGSGEPTQNEPGPDAATAPRDQLAAGAGCCSSGHVSPSITAQSRSRAPASAKELTSRISQSRSGCSITIRETGGPKFPAGSALKPAA